ncbi:MAG: DUF3039 domain-containing protein [Actinomycetota bacterium]|jgi:hypothetical protein
MTDTQTTIEAELAEPEVLPQAGDGDHDRFTHVVLEGFSPKKGDFVKAGTGVVEGMVNGVAVRALCGKEWIPGRDPRRYPICPSCREIAESMGWSLPAS